MYTSFIMTPEEFENYRSESIKSVANNWIIKIDAALIVAAKSVLDRNITEPFTINVEALDLQDTVAEKICTFYENVGWAEVTVDKRIVLIESVEQIYSDFIFLLEKPE